MKICTTCLEEKELPEFSKDKNKKDGLSYTCKACHKIKRRKHFIDNKEKAHARIRERKRNIRLFLTEYKIEQGCQKCGEKHPACLDLHHIDPTFKTIMPTEMSGHGWSTERMLIELENCEVLCANCHRKEHYVGVA